MAFAAADPAKYRDEIAATPSGSKQAQPGTGAWTYNAGFGRGGGGRQLQHPVRPARPPGGQRGRLRRRARDLAARPALLGADPGRRRRLGLHPDHGSPTGSMTCAGISSLIITGLKRSRGASSSSATGSSAAARSPSAPASSAGWTGWRPHFDVRQNPGRGPGTYYYLYGLERVGRLSGRRFFGDHDWYREGAAYLVRNQDRSRGPGTGNGGEVVTTSFALLFLSKGRSPVLVNKLRHGPGPDWNNDHDDVTNLVGVVSRDWKHLLTWQVVDPGSATVEDMLQAPIGYINGHEAPPSRRRGQIQAPRVRRARGRDRRRGLLRPPGVRRGFRALMKEVFPEPELELHPLADDHAVWRSKYRLDPDDPPALGDRARLPDRGDLLARRPVVLLEPARERPGQPPGPGGHLPGGEHRRLRHRPRAARRQAGRPRRGRLQGRTAPAAGRSGSPSSATPATGTSPRWRSPT